MTRKAWREIAAKAHAMIRAGHTIDAIKYLRDSTGCGLGEAYKAVNRLREVSKVTVAIALVIQAFALVGCSVSYVPTAPSPAESLGTLTVQVLDRADQTTGVQARVYVQKAFRGTTSAQGVLQVAVEVGHPCSVDVQAEGYRPMGVDVQEMTAGETWTFYLERLQ